MSADRHIEYGRAVVSLSRITRAIAELQIARGEVSVAAGEQRAAVRFCDEALLAARKAYADVEIVIRQLSRVCG